MTVKNSVYKMESISELIVFHRKQAGLSQSELANIAGVGKTSVFDIENGKLTFRYSTLMRILEALNIKCEWKSPLMGRLNKPSGEI